MRRATLVAWITLAAPLGGQESPLPPAGYGTLKQDDVAVRITTANLQIRLIPLHEEVIRLLAPDSYRSLNALRVARSAEIDSAAAHINISEPRVMFVTLFGLQPAVRFDPQQLFITSRNRFFRPLRFIPLTPGWGEQQVGQRQQLAGLFLFDSNIPLSEPFEVSFEGVSSRQWARSLRLLDQERSRALARWAAERQDTIPP